MDSWTTSSLGLAFEPAREVGDYCQAGGFLAKTDKWTAFPSRTLSIRVPGVSPEEGNALPAFVRDWAATLIEAGPCGAAAKPQSMQVTLWRTQSSAARFIAQVDDRYAVFSASGTRVDFDALPLQFLFRFDKLFILGVYDIWGDGAIQLYVETSSNTDYSGPNSEEALLELRDGRWRVIGYVAFGYIAF